MILVFDTETTGKADFQSPIQAEHQPHLVQFGAQLLDDAFKVRAELNIILKPNGWTIPESASAIHGITQEIAEQFGFDVALAQPLMAEMFNRSHVLVAHNFSFDSLIVHTLWHRLGMEKPFQDEHVKFCTMQAMTDICNIPGPYGNKWPKLEEAHRHCFNEDFDGAHDAMADVRACARVYRWLMERARLDANK